MRFGIAMFAALILCGIAQPATAQQGRKQVTVNAQLTIPDILILEEGASQTLQVDGKQLTRTTVYVTANRQWSLTVEPASPDSVRRIQLSGQNVAAPTRTQGRNGNAMPVEVEVEWKQKPTDATAPIIYNLAAH